MSDKYTTTGRVIHISPVETVGPKNTEKCQLVLEVGGDTPYPQYYPLDAFGVVPVLKYVKIGQTLEVTFGIKGREWKGKYYCNLSLISVNMDAIDNDEDSKYSKSAQSSQKRLDAQSKADGTYIDPDEDDDIPF